MKRIVFHSCLVRPALSLFLGVLLALMPFRLVLDAEEVSLQPLVASAQPVAVAKIRSKDGDDDDDDDDRRGRGRGRGGDDDDDDRDDDDRDDDDDDDRDDDDDDDRDDDDDDGYDDDDDLRYGSDTRGDRPSSAQVTSVEILPNGIIVIFSDGSREQIIDGVYTRLLSNGVVVASNRATGADRVRLRLLAEGRNRSRVSADAPAHPVRITLGRQSATVEYSNGWSEVVADGRYTMVDRYGNPILQRRASQADLERIQALAGR